MTATDDGADATPPDGGDKEDASGGGGDDDAPDDGDKVADDDLARIGNEAGNEDAGAIEPAGQGDGGLLSYTKAGGPDADEEMPLTAHIEELVRRVMVVVLASTVVMAVAFVFSEGLLRTVWYNFVDSDPHVYRPFGEVLTALSLRRVSTSPNGR